MLRTGKKSDCVALNVDVNDNHKTFHKEQVNAHIGSFLFSSVLLAKENVLPYNPDFCLALRAWSEIKAIILCGPDSSNSL